MDIAGPSEQPVLISLSFETSKEFKQYENDQINPELKNTYPCILCNEKFVNNDSKLVLHHLSSIHSIHVEDFENISLFSE